MGRVLGMGNALVDILIPLTNDIVLEQLNLPKGSMQLVDADTSNKILKSTGHKKSIKASGGSAANTIHGLAHLGIETGFFGMVGKDNWGDFFKQDMQLRNISTYLLENDRDTGRAIALISPDSERTFATCLGAAVELLASDIPNDLFSSYDILYVEGYLVQNHALILEAFNKAKASGLKTSLDLASYNVVEENLEFLRKLVADYVDILFANEEEAKAFSGERDNYKALNFMGELSEIAVLKMGAKGSLIKQNNKVSEIGVLKANAVDTTGAGDLYAAGFLYGLIKGLPLEISGQIAALLSAAVIEVVGPKMDEKKWTEIKLKVENLIRK